MLLNTWIEYKNNEEIQTIFGCPHCNNGKLILLKDNYIKKQYKWSEKKSEVYDNKGNYCGYDIYKDVSLISGVLICNNKDCNEITAFNGEIHGGEIPVFCEEMDREIDADVYHLNFIYLNPPIHIIPIHREYPDIIQKLLKESYSLYWNHSSSCVNKLRIIVEEILDYLRIPKKEKIKSGKNRGKFKNLSAHGRLGILKKKVKYEKLSKFLLAIKWIGNEGSHSHVDLSTEELLEVYNILQEALDLIYIKTDEKLKKRVDEINKKKGR